jgi:hypothetical protein
MLSHIIRDYKTHMHFINILKNFEKVTFLFIFLINKRILDKKREALSNFYLNSFTYLLAQNSEK